MSTKHSEKGVGLVEVLVSLAVLVMTLPVMGMGISLSQKLTTSSQKRLDVIEETDQLLNDVQWLLSTDQLVLQTSEQGSVKNLDIIRTADVTSVDYHLAIIPEQTISLNQVLEEQILAKSYLFSTAPTEAKSHLKEGLLKCEIKQIETLTGNHKRRGYVGYKVTELLPFKDQSIVQSTSANGYYVLMRAGARANQTITYTISAIPLGGTPSRMVMMPVTVVLDLTLVEERSDAITYEVINNTSMPVVVEIQTSLPNKTFKINAKGNAPVSVQQTKSQDQRYLVVAVVTNKEGEQSTIHHLEARWMQDLPFSPH